MPHSLPPLQHPRFHRREMVRAGAVGLLGLGMNHLSALRAADSSKGRKPGPARSVIYIFLSGGLAQHDSFDLKPHAPDDIRGAFQPIATATPGLFLCEHLPELARRSDKWALVRSLTHPYNEHSEGHQVMLSGRTPRPPQFSPNKPQPGDWPSIASVAADQVRSRTNLPPAVVLPERLVHRTGRVVPGQFGGLMGPQRDPWFLEASPFNGSTYGAYPEFEFHHAHGKEHANGLSFEAPNLAWPPDLSAARLDRRREVLGLIERQQQVLDRAASLQDFDRFRQAAVSLLTDPSVKSAFDVRNADPATQDRYGRNSFGWSLLMAKRLVEAGVSLVQVNLGNNETWDTHGNAFPNLKNFLLPPMDRGVSALIDDLADAGLLDSTLIVMAGEFGRTPKISHLPQHYALPGRDHWGGAQTVFFAGGGVHGGTVIGSTDKDGAYPASAPQTPENMAATIYDALGIPATAAWKDDLGRPHHVYFGDPIAGLIA